MSPRECSVILTLLRTNRKRWRVLIRAAIELERRGDIETAQTLRSCAAGYLAPPVAKSTARAIAQRTGGGK